MITELAGGLIAIGDWHAYSGMQQQMAASNEQAMRASMQAQSLQRRGMMNAWPYAGAPVQPDTFAAYRERLEVGRMRRELARPDWVFIWWLGFLGLGALLRWRFW